MKTLQCEFDNNQPEHFTNLDYILQLGENGRYGPLEEFVKGIETKGLLHLFKYYNQFGTWFFNIMEAEILNRTESKIDTCPKCGCNEFLCGHNKRG